MKRRDVVAQTSALQRAPTDVASLRKRVQADLDVVQDAHDAVSAMITESHKLLSTALTSENPIRQFKELTQAIASLSSTLVMLRDEGRATVREHVGKGATKAEGAHATDDPPADPPAPPRDGHMGMVLSTQLNFSSPKTSSSNPVTLQEFLNDVDEE